MISVGNLFSSFIFHADVVEQIRWWVIIILHELFLNQTINSYRISCWSSVFYFIQKCIRWISFERYYLTMPNLLLTSLSFSLTLFLKGKKIIVISFGNLFCSFFFHVDVVEQIRSWVKIILHQLFLNQTWNSYPITWWFFVFDSLIYILLSYTVQPKNNARARTSFCVRKKKFFLWLIAGHLSLSPGNRKNFFAAAW